MTLKDKALKKLRTRPRNVTLEQIAKETSLTEPWLRWFSSSKGDDANPSSNKIEELNNYLSNLGD